MAALSMCRQGRPQFVQNPKEQSYSFREADISGLIVGSWLLPSPNVCRSRRMPVPNGLRVTAKVAQEGFYASLQSTFGPGCPERNGVLKSGVAMQEGPDSYSGGGIIRLSGDAACSLQQKVPDGLASL